MRLIAQHSPGFDPALPWLDKDVHVQGETRLFQHILVNRRSPHTDREHGFTRLLCPDWVNVVAFTEQGELLLVEQWRHGIGASTLEVVGGVCDPGEEPTVSGRRELLEETGHKPGRWISLGSCAPNPAIQDNRCHFFLALECRAVAALDLDPSEELRVWAAPWPEAETLLREGRIDHALVQVALLRLFLWEGWEELRRQLAGDKSS
jgi:8-oxo-dGTP pyrophosphatase MutT (NUDIX family)